jgi:hypothetical protein
VVAASVTGQRRVPRAPVSRRPSRLLYRTTSRVKKFDDLQIGIVRALLVFVSQTVVITGLLYYFGWVRTQADFGYFGVDPSLLSYTTADYVLRSVNSSFPFLISMALVALLLLGLHRWVLVRVVHALMRALPEKVLSAFVSTAPLLGVALGAVVLARLLFPDHIVWPRGLALPLTLLLIVGLVGYSQYLRAVRDGMLGRRKEDRHFGWRAGIGAVVLAVLGLLSVLWLLTIYAAQSGERIAVDSARTLRDEPEIIIYSTDRIAIAGSGVTVDEISQAGSRYRYRYSGLRLLVQAGGRYILIPAGWRKGSDSVFLVPIDNTIRLDIIN